MRDRFEQGHRLIHPGMGRDQHQLGPGHDRLKHPGHQARVVVRSLRHHDHIALVGRHGLSVVTYLVAHRPVGQRRTLRPPGGAGRKLNQGQIVAGDDR